MRSTIRNMMGALIAVAVLALAQGCSILAPATDKIADGVDRYCDEPVQTRHAIRAELDRESPHTVRVYCAGDADTPPESAASDVQEELDRAAGQAIELGEPLGLDRDRLDLAGPEPVALGAHQLARREAPS